MKIILDNDKVYKNIDRDTAELIKSVTNLKLKIEKSEVINMCLAEDQWLEERLEEGLKKHTIELAKALLARGKDSYEEIASLLKISVEEVMELDNQTVQ